MEARARRRAFLSRSATIAQLVLLDGAWAAISAPPRLGILFAGIPAQSPQLEGLYERLGELGYVDGRTLQIQLRSADGSFERLPQLARELLSLRPDVLVCSTTPSVIAARDLTRSVPIVMVAVGDPLGQKFASSLGRPDRNITGPTLLNTELTRKRVEVLRELLPSAKRVAALWNPLNPQSAGALKELSDEFSASSTDVVQLAARSPSEIDPALRQALATRADALMVLPDSLTYSFRRHIIDFSNNARLPSFYTYREEVEDGGLVAYGVNLRNEYRRAADYVHRILLGAQPAELPIEQAKQFELVINLATAQRLGVTVPLSLRLRADRMVK